MPLVGSSPGRLPLMIRGHGPTGRRQLRTLEIRVRLPVTPLKRTRSCGPAAKAAPLQGNDRWFDSIRDHFGPDTPTGRAARLKPERLRVRLPLWAHNWLGRQPADHLGLEPGMLWVRLPPEPLKTNMPSWSSLECSPACHAGDRGFKSRRGRLTTWHGTQTGKAAKLKPW